MIRLRSAIPYFIMIVCPLVIYYFLLEEQAAEARLLSSRIFSQSSLSFAAKVKNKGKYKNPATNPKHGDFSEQILQKLNSKTSSDSQSLLRQLLVLEPFNQSAILSLKDETLSWLNALDTAQRLDVLQIIRQRPSGEWQENLDNLQKLPMEELQQVLFQSRLSQKIPKENLDQKTFDTL